MASKVQGKGKRPAPSGGPASKRPKPSAAASSACDGDRDFLEYVMGNLSSDLDNSTAPKPVNSDSSDDEGFVPLDLPNYDNLFFKDPTIPDLPPKPKPAAVSVSPKAVAINNGAQRKSVSPVGPKITSVTSLAPGGANKWGQIPVSITGTGLPAGAIPVSVMPSQLQAQGAIPVMIGSDGVPLPMPGFKMGQVKKSPAPPALTRAPAPTLTTTRRSNATPPRVSVVSRSPRVTPVAPVPAAAGASGAMPGADKTVSDLLALQKAGVLSAEQVVEILKNQQRKEALKPNSKSPGKANTPVRAAVSGALKSVGLCAPLMSSTPIRNQPRLPGANQAARKATPAPPIPSPRGATPVKGTVSYTRKKVKLDVMYKMLRSGYPTSQIYNICIYDLENPGSTLMESVLVRLLKQYKAA